jgi:hemerythrin-like metal-binding protein
MGISLAGRSTNNETQQSVVEEHRLLAERIDQVSKHIDTFLPSAANRNSSDISGLAVLLAELLEMARAHFQHEEALMAKHEFPGLIFHKRDHDYLLKSLTDFTTALSHGTVPFSKDMGVNLRSWLTYHIKKYDDVYVEFVEAAKPRAGD